MTVDSLAVGDLQALRSDYEGEEREKVVQWERHSRPHSPRSCLGCALPEEDGKGAAEAGTAFRNFFFPTNETKETDQ